MANTKLTDLTAITVPTSSDLIYIVQGGASKKITLANATSLSGRVYNVKDYGAVGNDSTNDKVAIQAAIDAQFAAGTGYVYFPAATYKITSSLSVYSSTNLIGDGMELSSIHQTTLNANGITGDGLSSVLISDLAIKGNGSGSTAGTGTGIGIYLTYGGNGNNPYHNFRNVMVRNWGSDGIKIQTAIVSNFEKVYSAFNGGHGFNWYEGGTSCDFQDCFARQNAQSGFRFNGSAYIALTGCAADNNGISYEIIGCQGIGFFSCGTEGALKNGGSYDGIGWKIDNGSNIGLHSCWCYDNRNIGIWVTGTAQVVQIDCADNGPNGTAVNFIKVDAGSNASINGLHNTTANSLATGTTVTINDGAGGIRGLDLYALNQTATTVPYFNANKALVSSAVTPTELGYVSGVTSAIQTQINTKITASSTDTLTNKRITPRSNTITSSATPAINTDTTDIFTITALGTAITSMTSSLSGTPTNGQKLTIRIKDDGTARLITWGASFASRGATLPTTTVLGKYMYVGLIWNSTASIWDCVAVAQEA